MRGKRKTCKVEENEGGRHGEMRKGGKVGGMKGRGYRHALVPLN